jgi:hypothetical protein
LARRSSPEALYSHLDYLAANGPLYAQYRIPRYYFFIPWNAAALFRALVIAFGNANGLVQVALLVAIEFFSLVALFALRPYKTRGDHAFSVYLAITRFVCTGLLIAFIEKVGVKPIPRVAIGLVTAVIFSVAVVVVILNIAYHIGKVIWGLYRKGQAPPSALSYPDASMIEKASIDSPRPRNPTPEHCSPVDPHNNYLLPGTPTSTIYHNNRDSRSTDLGSVMPRRFSITPLSSPTEASHVSSPQSFAFIDQHIDEETPHGSRHDQHHYQ